jgi:Vps16, N-terminal region.
MPPNPLANWEKVGDSFYRKIAVYDAIFEDDIELENYIVAGAPYGGAIGNSPFLEKPEIWTNVEISALSRREQAIQASRWTGFPFHNRCLFILWTENQSYKRLLAFYG